MSFVTDVCLVYVFFVGQVVELSAICSTGRGFPKGEIFSKESHFNGDQFFWLPDTAHHYNSSATASSGKRLSMYLHDVTIESTGPTYGSVITSALGFGGHKDSYATFDLQATVDSTIADEYFTWFFRIFSSSSAKGVILEYSDEINPLRIEQDLNLLRASFGDSLGGFHEVVLDVFTPVKSWVTVAVTYSVYDTDLGLKIVQFLDVETESFYENSTSVCPADKNRRINATGCVRIGSSYDGNRPAFRGRLACVQLYKGYLLKSYEYVYYYCDPNMKQSADMVVQDITVDWPAASPCIDILTTESPTTESSTTEIFTTESPTTESSTTEIFTTESPTTESSTTEIFTTESPTTESSTTEIFTTESPTTESSTTEIFTTESPTTESSTTEIFTTDSSTTESLTSTSPTTDSSTKNPPVATTASTNKQATTTKVGQTSLLPRKGNQTTRKSKNQCGSFKQVAKDAIFSHDDVIMKQLRVKNSAKCVSACYKTSGCVAIAYQSNHCILGRNNSFVAAAGPPYYAGFAFV